MSTPHEGAGTGQEEWPEVMATVLSCTYRPRTGRAMAFGLPASKHYRITYNYWAEGELRTAEMWAQRPIPQGSVFPLRVDPEVPSRLWDERAGRVTEAGAGGRRRVLLVGVAGSVLLSLGWFLVLRGCR